MCNLCGCFISAGNAYERVSHSISLLEHKFFLVFKLHGRSIHLYFIHYLIEFVFTRLLSICWSWFPPMIRFAQRRCAIWRIYFVVVVNFICMSTVRLFMGTHIQIGGMSHHYKFMCFIIVINDAQSAGDVAIVAIG